MWKQLGMVQRGQNREGNDYKRVKKSHDKSTQTEEFDYVLNERCCVSNNNAFSEDFYMMKKLDFILVCHRAMC